LISANRTRATVLWSIYFYALFCDCSCCY